MRNLALIPLLLLLALLVAGCAGSAEEEAEANWAKEAETVVNRFRHTGVPGLAEESEAQTSAQAGEELLYRGLSRRLLQLGSELKATDAPEACVAYRESEVEMFRRLAAYFRKLGAQDNLTLSQYSAMKREGNAKMEKTLTEMGEFETEEC